MSTILAPLIPTHNFNTVNFYKSVIDFGASEKKANFALQIADFASDRQIESLPPGAEILRYATEERF